MWYAWYLWLSLNFMAANIQNNTPVSFAILQNPLEVTKARLFLTNAEEEYKYLHFCRDLTTMANTLELYDVLISSSGACLHSLSFLL